MLPDDQEVFKLDLGGNLPSIIVNANDPILRDNPRINVKIIATIEDLDSVDSDPLELTFTDTCTTTQFIARNIPTITAQLRSPEPKRQSVPPFEDTVSREYGDGTGLCGG